MRVATLPNAPLPPWMMFRVLLFRVTLEEGGAFQRTQLRANANLREVIEGRLAEIRVRSSQV